MPKSEKKKTNGFNRPTSARPQAPRRVVAYARPATAPIVPVNGTGVTILELSRDQCHAVIGEPRPAKGLPLYCGNSAWMGTPYCEGHHAAFHRHD